jgi:hypothetical protein
MESPNWLVPRKELALITASAIALRKKSKFSTAARRVVRLELTASPQGTDMCSKSYCNV